jgi:hypothetical protein
MADYKGVIIEESLADKSILQHLKVLETELEPVTEDMQTPWLRKWTLHTVHIPEEDAGQIARDISQALEDSNSWYADYQNETTHYIIFKNKIFKINKEFPREYRAPMEYGIGLGIPKHQVNFLNE